jgi:hypothetical protein
MSIKRTPTDAEAPGERSFRFGWAEWFCSVLCALFLAAVALLIFRDSVDESAVSNRSFASPALGLATTISTYALWRIRSRPIFVRVFGWLVLTLILYLALGLAFILLNASLGELLRP